MWGGHGAKAPAQGVLAQLHCTHPAGLTVTVEFTWFKVTGLGLGFFTMYVVAGWQGSHALGSVQGIGLSGVGGLG